MCPVLEASTHDTHQFNSNISGSQDSRKVWKLHVGAGVTQLSLQRHSCGQVLDV
jgi:hypothetical protein